MNRSFAAQIVLVFILTFACQTDSDKISTTSGLNYKEIVIGNGRKPVLGDKLKVHYTGMLEDGTIFDNSYDRGFPIQFILGQGQVIKAWEEGLKSMNVGGKRKLIVPPHLGYGDLGSPPIIPPNSTLIFEVELIAIEKRDTEFDIPGRDERTDSGIMMIIHKEGSGIKPSNGKSVEIHYTGMLHTGKVFDSTHEKGETYNFVLGKDNVIKGWEEALYLMRKGEKRSVIIPPNLGYGSKGKGKTIPPNATLIYEIELVDVK
jgi:peptidylprolyl isomerase